jgi:protein-disulfide isomerase
VLAAAGAVLVLAAVVVVLVLKLTGNGTSNAPISVNADLSSVNGIQQHGLVLGNPQAKVTLTEYVDTSCPICKDYVLNTFPTISTKYVRTGKVKIEARIVAFVGPSSSEQGRELVLAAARQHKAWQMLELLYQNQGDETQAWVTDDLSRALGAKIPGLNVDRLMTDASSAAVLTEAVKLDKQMRDDSVSATPSFLLTTPDGQRHLLGAGYAPASSFAQAFDKALKGK